MATARRMSRASGMGAGIPLPDLLSTIPGPEEGSVKERLEKMVEGMGEKVRLIRQPARAGLMRTRMVGVMESKSQVLTFLDSHIEATEGWLEPLLERVHQNPKAIACPVIEEVNDKTFQYKFVTRDLVGVFFWNLDFGWTAVKRPDWSPYDTPVMAGGLFSIRFILWEGDQHYYSLCLFQEGLVCRIRVL